MRLASRLAAIFLSIAAVYSPHAAAQSTAIDWYNQALTKRLRGDIKWH